MKKRISLIFIMILAIGFIPLVNAKENNFFADDNLTIKKNIGKTVFAAGNNVDLTSNIDGSSFVAGNGLTISSSQDYIFAAGNTIELDGAYAKDAFIAGSTINVKKSVFRDLYIVGQNVKIKSDITGDLYIAGENVTIDAKIDGDVHSSADKLTIGEDAVILGTLKYDEDTKLQIAETAQITKKKSYKSEKVNVNLTTGQKITATIISKVTSYLSILLITIILMAIAKGLFNKVDEKEKSVNYFLKISLYGFIALIAIPVAAIMLLITVIGLPLSIISLLLYGILIYLSIIITAYYLGKWLLSDKIKNDYLLITVSLLIIYVLKLIPVIGGFVSFFSLIFGLGMFISLLKTDKKTTKK